MGGFFFAVRYVDVVENVVGAQILALWEKGWKHLNTIDSNAVLYGESNKTTLRSWMSMDFSQFNNLMNTSCRGRLWNRLLGIANLKPNLCIGRLQICLRWCVLNFIGQLALFDFTLASLHNLSARAGAAAVAYFCLFVWRECLFVWRDRFRLILSGAESFWWPVLFSMTDFDLWLGGILSYD